MGGGRERVAARMTSDAVVNFMVLYQSFSVYFI